MIENLYMDAFKHIIANMVVVVINRAFNCFKGEMKWRVQRKSWLEGFRPKKVKGKIKIEKDRK